ncbi:hypothetical protein AX16_005234 [Volvariella volvacea WC 439]|nr:hypothetical protein AX16_005234 [Volvariella volvacea WC 439]
MSFQNLISGAECATQSNPLSQILKHADGDRSLHQDRIAGPSSARLQQLGGAAGPVASEQDLALARQFFDGDQQPRIPPPGLPMEHPAFMMPAPGQAGTSSGMRIGCEWVMDHPKSQAMERHADSPSSWGAEFDNARALSPATPSPQQALGNAYNHARVAPMPHMYGALSMGPYASTFLGHNTTFVQDKGKGKNREADFEAAFAQVLSEEAQIGRSEGDQAVEEIEAALKRTTLDSKEEVATQGDATELWDIHSQPPASKEELARWEADFNQLMTANREELQTDYGVAMQQAWDSGLGDFQEGDMGQSTLKFDPNGIPILGPYVFEAKNKYLNQKPQSSLLASAKALLEQNGSLSEAALMLEAAIQQGELGEGGYETWILLGETRNMDEREEAGMRALAEGVKRAEEGGTPGPGMLSLSISYTNESYERASYTTLVRWLRARYPQHPIPDDLIKALPTSSAWHLHDRITEVFLELARNQYSRGIIDPDVQIAVGVLFYTNGEYERAKDCFETALSERPHDYLLWNRLGSSLSNGNKPEEALSAYREALSLRPTYTRAIYNVGVACLNIGAYKEAAEHFLSALAMQKSNGDTSQSLWFTLRRAFLAMDRADLADLARVDSKTDLDIFRKEGFDF